MIIRVFENIQSLANASAIFIAEQAKIKIAERGQFNIALSGGTTPAATYRRLAQAPFFTEIPWTQVHTFWSDERCVPPENPESNFSMAKDALLKHVPIPVEHIHRLKGELPPEEAAMQANLDLAAHFSGAEIPSFDLILLGLGDDGHTASLFPGSEAINVSSEFVVSNYVHKMDAWRLTFAYPLINAASQIIFMVSGDSKTEVVKKVIEGRDPTLPASWVQPTSGNLHWYLDRGAAAQLSGQTLGN